MSAAPVSQSLVQGGNTPHLSLQCHSFLFVAAGHRRQDAAAVVSAVEVGFICAGDRLTCPFGAGMHRAIGILLPGPVRARVQGVHGFFGCSVLPFRNQDNLVGAKEITWVR